MVGLPVIVPPGILLHAERHDADREAAGSLRHPDESCQANHPAQLTLLTLPPNLTDRKLLPGRLTSC